MGGRAFFLAGVGLIVGTALGWIFLQPLERSVRGETEETQKRAIAFEEQTGLRIVRVALTAGGGMIDLRYQVLDPEKARAFCTIRNGSIVLKEPPMIILEGTGEILKTSWMGHSHAKALRAGVTYYVLLLNTGGKVQRGHFVTVLIGGVPVEHLPVR